MKDRIKSKGISLIVLVITIIVIIILAGAVILSIMQNNPTQKAKEAVFKSDVANFKAELGMYHVNELSKTTIEYDAKFLDGDKEILRYNDEVLSGKTMIDVISSMKQKVQYTQKFIIREGKLVYVGNNTDERYWAEQININNDVKRPTVRIELPNPAEVKSGEAVKYTIRFSSDNKLINFKAENIELLTKDKQSKLNGITVGQIGGTDSEKTVEVTIDTTNLETNEYILQVKEGTITDEVLEVTNNEVYSEGFIVDNTVPGVPEIQVDPITPTNQSVTVTINYSDDTISKEYKIGSGNWQIYNGPFTITENIDIIARATNRVSSETIGEVIAIRNIDKVNPNAANISVSSSNDKIIGSITVSDNSGGSGIDFTKSKYIINTTSSTYGTNDNIWNSSTTINASPTTINETKSDGTYYVHVLVVDKAGNKIVSKSSSGIVISNIVITDPGWDSSKGVNAPALKTGMTPIKWNGTTWVNTTPSDSEWYDYTNKKWANAQTNDGSFWVWIPRYEYKIPNSHTSTAQTILVNFKQGTSTEATSGYIMHPAFTFGTAELTGIWVAKFEATAREGVSNWRTSWSAADNVTTNNVKIEPNVSSWRNIDIENMYLVVRKMETDATYGWGTVGTGINTHLMKNIEWGAISYLSHSIYGKNSEIWINPYYEYKDSKYDHKTGQAGDSISSSNTTITYTYETTNGMQASTTGNIYGIYDMSGGAGEYTAAYVYYSGAKAGARYPKDADNKYKDEYSKGSNTEREKNYEANKAKVGDAVYETSSSQETSNNSWYGDYSYMPYSNVSLFQRGGSSTNGSAAGIFSFLSVSGTRSTDSGFRPVLCVSNTL